MKNIFSAPALKNQHHITENVELLLKIIFPYDAGFSSCKFNTLWQVVIVVFCNVLHEQQY